MRRRRRLVYEDKAWRSLQFISSQLEGNILLNIFPYTPTEINHSFSFSPLGLLIRVCGTI